MLVTSHLQRRCDHDSTNRDRKRADADSNTCDYLMRLRSVQAGKGRVRVRGGDNTRTLELRPPVVTTGGRLTLELHAPMREIGRELMAAGRLQASSAAAERLSQMFATTSPPWCPDIF